MNEYNRNVKIKLLKKIGLSDTEIQNIENDYKMAYVSAANKLHKKIHNVPENFGKISVGLSDYNDIFLTNLKRQLYYKIGNNDTQNLTETGEMGQHDIQPGGEDYEWAKNIQDDIIKMGKLTKGKVKFLKMNPFDKYQGPYASVTVNGKFDSIWSVSNPGSEAILYIERLDWTGTMEELASAVNGDAEAIDIVTQNTEGYR